MKQRTKTRPGSTRGESMIFAMLLLFVFLSIGVSVMTAAAGAAATVNARAADRQCYYLARSVLDTLDTALQTGQMGAGIRSKVLHDVLADADGGVSLNGEQIPLTVSTADASLAGMGVENAKLTLQGAGSALTRDAGGAPTQILVSFDKAELHFAAMWNDKRYEVNVTYSYLGWAKRNSVTGNWEWTDKWSISKFDMGA